MGEVVLGKSQGLEMEMVFSRDLSIGGGRWENYSRDGEEILRHPSLVCFCDLGTDLGDIMVL